MGRRSSRSRSRSRSHHHGKRRFTDAASTGVISIARKGYAFVDTPEGEFFILKGYLYGAMDGDLVEVVRQRWLEAQRRARMQEAENTRLSSRNASSSHRVSNAHSTSQRSIYQGARSQDEMRYAEASFDGRDRRDMLGSVRRVLERAHTTVIGVVRKADGLVRVIPEDDRIQHDFFITQGGTGVKVTDGDVVLVRITVYPGKLEAAQGFIEEILGHEDEQGIDLTVILRRHGIETEFSAAALFEAQALAAEPFAMESPTAESLAAKSLAITANRDQTSYELTRLDLRDRQIFTIDPSDAHDFDDALSVDYVEGVLRLGVHIADVSSYVAWDSALDLNARRRTTSVYLPGRVIPMLPPLLSDELCSLNPGVDRLAFTVDMYLRNNGTVEHAEFYPSLIRSAQRFTYDEVQEILETHRDDRFLSALCLLDKFAKIRARLRFKRGAIDFDSSEPRILLDDKGEVTQVLLQKKTDATALVEEAMILANETVASYLLQHNWPCVYRVHEEPLQNALAETLPTLQEFGYAEQIPPQTSFEIQEILTACKDKPEYDLVSTLLLRAMKRALYRPVFTTHFGLASSAYAHFTSPIRRYPDLLVHRLLKLCLIAGQLGCASINELHKALPSLCADSMLSQLDWMCEHCSEQEKETDQATYEAVKLRLCEYFSTRVDSSYQGIVSGVNTYGFFVREDTTHAEGFVARESLDGLFVYEPARYRWIDHNTQTIYRLGQTVTVRLVSVDLSRSELSFAL